MKLSYLVANASWAFTLGTTLVRLDGEPMFYTTHREAREAAKRHGLKVNERNGVVL